MYNSLYKESVESNDIQDLWYANNTPAGPVGGTFNLSNNYQQLFLDAFGLLIKPSLDSVVVSH